MGSQVDAAVIAGLVAVIVAYLGSRWEIGRQAKQFQHELARDKQEFMRSLELQESRLRTELRTEFMAEAAIHEMLRVAEPLRSFDRIKARVGGFDDEELRRLLVRSGALRYKNPHTGAELWGLRDRNET